MSNETIEQSEVIDETQAIEQAEVSEDQSDEVEDGSPVRADDVDVLTFVKAFKAARAAKEGMEGVSRRTKLKVSTCQTKATTLRKGKIQQVNKTDEQGNVIYHSADGEGFTTDRDKAKRTKANALVPVKIDLLDDDGNPVYRVKPLPLPEMPRGGGRSVDQSIYDEALALLTEDGEDS